MLRIVENDDEIARMEAEDRARKKHFAAHVAYGTPLVRAMRLCKFDLPSKSKAVDLLADSFVREQMELRFEELRQSLRNSREAVVAQLDEAIEMATNLENPAAVVAGVVAKAKVLGLLNTPAGGNMPAKITVEWGDEQHETIYEKTNPLLHEAVNMTLETMPGENTTSINGIKSENSNKV